MLQVTSPKTQKAPTIFDLKDLLTPSGTDNCPDCTHGGGGTGPNRRPI